MFGNSPYGGWPPQYPNQPIVFIPPTASSGMSLDDVTRQISALENLKKALKEEKKDEKKDDKKKDGDVSILSVALLMILISPVTGVFMSRFFQWGMASILH